MQRLFPHAISRDKQSALPPFPNGEREHASKMLYAIGSVLFVQMHNDFGVGMGGETVAFGFQRIPQFGEIINFAIENKGSR